MKKFVSVTLFVINIILIYCFISLSSSVNVRNYLEGRFPSIYIIYLFSLEDLDSEEMEFIDLLEELPEDKQRFFVKRVYEEGFSLKILEELRSWEEKKEIPYLRVAYPSQAEQKIWNSPLYVFGQTDASPDVRVTVNDKEVEKFDPRTGNFLTLVDIPQDKDFPVVVSVSRGMHQNSVTKKVFYPSIWQEMPEEPLSIHSSYLQPRQDQILKEGDQLIVAFQGSPGAEASFCIGKQKNEIIMEESRNNVFPTLIRGIYTGSYIVQAKDIPLLRDGALQSITVTLYRRGKQISRKLPGRVSFISGFPLRIIEVIGDNTRIYRINDNFPVTLGSTLGGNGLSTEVMGYDVLPGTQFEVSGIAGDYFRIKLGEHFYLIHSDDVRQIEDTSIKKPFSNISVINFLESQKDVEIRLDTQERIPFIIEDEPTQLKVFLYGARISDFIHYEGNSSYVKKVKVEPGNTGNMDSVSINIELVRQIHGFDYHWEGCELVINIRKLPRIEGDNPLKNKVIVIDPGHGGKYSGAIGPGDVHEKEVVLEIGSYLKNSLVDKDARVIMTRSRDVNIPLQERIDTAIENQADIFVSIHANAHAVGADAINYHGHMTLYNYKYNQKLAEIMLDKLVERIGLPRTKVWQRKDLVVLRQPQIPSVMVETAFMMHPDDNWYLFQPVYQKEFAYAIMEGIVSFFLTF